MKEPAQHSPKLNKAPRRPEKRNLFVQVDEELKETLKSLAKKSEMTLEQYLGAVLRDAVASNPIFKLVPVRLKDN